MNPLIASLERHAAARPHARALHGDGCAVTYAELQQAIAGARALLCFDGVAPVAVALDNGPAWAIVDLALMAGDRPSLPLPSFFSPAQQVHALRDAGARWLLTDRAFVYEPMLAEHGMPAERVGTIDIIGTAVTIFELTFAGHAALPAGTAKVTYTSGTTGAPKGVCLSAAAMSAVALSLAEAAELGCEDRHLALLPLSTLLENIAGVYAPLAAGACTVLPPLTGVGADAAGYRFDMLARALHAAHATTAITVPEILSGLCTALEHGAHPLHDLRFLAVGGARVSVDTLHRAAALGLPVYEGYGLSECASVVALNTRHAYRCGSVGRVLPHAQVRIGDDGEIHVRGSTLLGYTDGVRHETAWYATGDIGHIDAEGYLYVTGRKRNVFVTSYGRNVAPEWVESELTACHPIAQAWVHGESRPWNTAVITPAAGASDASIDTAVCAANERLPEYARVRRWVRSEEPFSAANGQLTTNGRLKRSALLAAYRNTLDLLYTETADDVLR